MNYSNFHVDFIERTLKIIEQYEEMVEPVLPDKEVFEVTLLINCLLGLLILPNEHCYNKLPRTKVVELQAWGIPKDAILIEKSGKHGS